MQRFMFENYFDEEIQARLQAEEEERVVAEAEEIANAPPTFTVEEMEAAKDAAYQQGRQEGMANAMAGIEQQTALTLENVATKLPQIFDKQTQWRAEIERESIDLATQIMRKLAPELMRGTELPQIEHVINQAFSFLTDQPKVIIRVSDELEEALKGNVDLMATRVGYEGEVVLVGDPELEATDCRISWYAGAVERALSETWEQLDGIVQRSLDAMPTRTDQWLDGPDSTPPADLSSDFEPTSDESNEIEAGEIETGEVETGEIEDGEIEVPDHGGQEFASDQPVDEQISPEESAELSDTELVEIADEAMIEDPEKVGDENV